MGLLTRTGFSVCFHIPRVLKKRRQKKKRQLGALICVNPRTLRGRSCRMWNIRQGCRGWQGICRKVFPGMLSAVSVAEKLEGGVFQKGSCHVVSVFLFWCVVVLHMLAFQNSSQTQEFPLPVLGSWSQPALGIRAALPQLGQICEEIPGNCILIWGVSLWLCCAPRTWTVGVLSWFGPLSWKLHTLKCKIPLTVVKYHHKSLIWRLEVIKPRGCLLLKTLGQENKQLGAHLEHGCFWNRHGKYWNSS